MNKGIYKEFDYMDGNYRFVGTFIKLGYRCGYVGVPEGHPWYGKDDDCEGPNKVQCHWGLTYAGDGRHFLPEDDDSNFWYFGFDCGHYCDVQDCETARRYSLVNDNEYLYMKFMARDLKRAMSQDGENFSIKDRKFVEDNCKLIAAQLRVAEKESN